MKREHESGRDSVDAGIWRPHLSSSALDSSCLLLSFSGLSYRLNTQHDKNVLTLSPDAALPAQIAHYPPAQMGKTDATFLSPDRHNSIRQVTTSPVLVHLSRADRSVNHIQLVRNMLPQLTDHKDEEGHVRGAGTLTLRSD
eukprot:96929-Hanusia_phi.AAC.4